MSVNRIGQILFEPDKGLELKNLFCGKNINKIQINENLVNELNHIKNECIYNSKFENYFTKEIHDLKKARILELLNLDQTDINGVKYLVNNRETIIFDSHYNAISQSIKNELFTLSLDYFIKIIKEELGLDTVFKPEIIKALLLQHPYIDQIEENNEQNYRCKWEYLSNVDLKLKRILLDEYRQMTKQEIIDEYNYRAQQTNIDTLNLFTLAQDDNFKLCGGNGNWVYVKVYEGTGVNLEQNLTEFIEQFFNSQEGKATYFEILNSVKEIGIFKHTEGSIRAEIFKIASASLNDNNLFIHDDYAKQYPEIELAPNKQLHLGHKFILKLIEILKNTPNNELESSILIKQLIENLNEDGVAISKGNCSQYMRIFLEEEDSVIEEVNENGKRLIQLDLEKLQLCNLNRIGKQKEKEHITTIRASAINYLKTIDGGKSQKIAILANIKAKGEYPVHLKSDSIFYKILSDKSIFETITYNGVSYVQLRADKEIVKKPFSEEIENEIVGKDNIVDTTNHPQIQQQYIQRQPYNWEQIRSSFTMELYYYRLDEPILIQGVDSFYKALHIDNQIDFWGNQFLQTISNLWFFQTDKYDRHIYLRTMANDYETFIKRFELCPNNSTGLSTVIESIPLLYDLRNYDETCRIRRLDNYDRTKRTFSIIINKLISLRNKSTHNASHPIFDMGMSSQTKTITDFIALYIYTAYLLSNNM